MLLPPLQLFAMEAPAPAWNAQDTVMYVPDPELEDMGQGPMAPGAMVYAYIKNNSSKPVSLARITWGGRNVEDLAAEYPHTAVWWRLNPHTVPPGGLGEIALRLRNEPGESREMAVMLSSGEVINLSVAPRAPEFRIQTLSAAADRRRVFLYVEEESGNALPEAILLDGAPVPGTVTWLSEGYTAAADGPRFRAAMVELSRKLPEGAWHTWTVKAAAGKAPQAGTTLRMIPEPFGFGVSGTADFKRLSEAGFDTLHSFHFLGTRRLDEAAGGGMRVVMHEYPHEFPEVISLKHQAHPGLMGYNIFDEPDVHDDIIGLRQGRPWGKRVGIKAPEMVGRVQAAAGASPRAPVFMTLNMTFFPASYYTYGPIADIMKADFYPVTHARPAGDIRVAAAHAKRGTAPRPLGFIYQCNREDWSNGRENEPPYNGYAGRDDVLSRGIGFFRDDARPRGFGRAPAGGEVELQIAYLLGEGVKNFWGYSDATECIGSHGILYTGARDLPDVMEALESMAAALSHVKTEIALAHPVSWASADRPGVLVRTLLAGRDSALVVALNENYHSSREGFSSTPAGSVEFTFHHLPWLRAEKVERITPGGGGKLPVELSEGGASWIIPALEHTAIFRVSGEPEPSGNRSAGTPGIQHSR